MPHPIFNITIDFAAGGTIFDLIETAINVAKENKCIVKFEVNQRSLMATPHSSLKEICIQYQSYKSHLNVT